MYLKISFVGYLTQEKSLQLTAGKPSVNIGTVTLPTDAIMLGEAVIVAEAPQVTIQKILLAITLLLIVLLRGRCGRIGERTSGSRNR